MTQIKDGFTDQLSRLEQLTSQQQYQMHLKEDHLASVDTKYDLNLEGMPPFLFFPEVKYSINANWILRHFASIDLEQYRMSRHYSIFTNHHSMSNLRGALGFINDSSENDADFVTGNFTDLLALSCSELKTRSLKALQGVTVARP